MSEKEINITNKYPFTVPDAYFDNLTARVMDRISSEDTQPKATVVPLKKNPFRFTSSVVNTISIAASVALLVLVSYQFIPRMGTGSDNAMAEQVIESEMDYMYDDNELLYSMVDNSDIYNYLSGYED